MKTGQQAKLIQPTVIGEIVDTEYDKENECLKHLLEYVDADGEVQHRWFNESELEGV